jgi:succinate-acetate transporter protein
MAQAATYHPPATASSTAAPGADIADPAPLGLCGFALTTFVLSSINAGWFDVKTEPVVIGLALFYGGFAQLLAGMWEFKKANTFGATAFTSYAAFWLALATYFILQGHLFTIPKDQTANAVGLFLLGWTIFTGIMMIASFRLNGALIAVFVLLFVTFALLTLGRLSNTTTWFTLGGYTGLATALAAWYTAMAGVLKGTFKRDVIPVWPVAR